MDLGIEDLSAIPNLLEDGTYDSISPPTLFKQLKREHPVNLPDNWCLLVSGRDVQVPATQAHDLFNLLDKYRTEHVRLKTFMSAMHKEAVYSLHAPRSTLAIEFLSALEEFKMRAEALSVSKRRTFAKAAENH